MGDGSRGQEGVLPWIFIHDTDKVDGGLIALFFHLVFSVGPSGNFSAEALVDCTRKVRQNIAAKCQHKT